MADTLDSGFYTNRFQGKQSEIALFFRETGDLKKRADPSGEARNLINGWWRWAPPTLSVGGGGCPAPAVCGHAGDSLLRHTHRSRRVAAFRGVVCDAASILNQHGLLDRETVQELRFGGRHYRWQRRRSVHGFQAWSRGLDQECRLPAFDAMPLCPEA